jgi:hypothetical protein
VIYRVKIEAPAINEEVTLAAETAEEARQLAVASAVARAVDAAEVTVTPMPPAAA